VTAVDLVDRSIQPCAQVRRDTREGHGCSVITMASRVKQSLRPSVSESDASRIFVSRLPVSPRPLVQRTARNQALNLVTSHAVELVLLLLVLGGLVSETTGCYGHGVSMTLGFTGADTSLSKCPLRMANSSAGVRRLEHEAGNGH